MSKNNGNNGNHEDSDADIQVKEILESVNRNSFDGAFHSDAGFNAVKTMVEPKDTLAESVFLLDLDDPQLPQAIAWQNEVFGKYGLELKKKSLDLNIKLRSSQDGKRIKDFIDAVIGERRQQFRENMANSSFGDKIKKFSGDSEKT
jgi:hypothetical protein